MNSTVENGVFDFTNYPNLKKVTLINCDNLEWVKLPDYDVETDGMSNNPNLKWVDAGTLPSFKDDNDYDGKVGTEYEGKKFKRYSDSPKLILCSEGVFNNCPKYAMLRSDYNMFTEMTGKNGTNIAYTNITVSPKCTSLSNTFCLNSTSNSEDLFNMDTAIRFIGTCVPDDVKEHITSLSGCFKGRKM